jgi:hypothetical protein
MLKTDKNDARDKTNKVDSGWRQVNNKKTKTSSARGKKCKGLKPTRAKERVGCSAKLALSIYAVCSKTGKPIRFPPSSKHEELRGKAKPSIKTSASCRFTVTG